MGESTSTQLKALSKNLGLVRKIGNYGVTGIQPYVNESGEERLKVLLRWVHMYVLYIDITYIEIYMCII